MGSCWCVQQETRSLCCAAHSTGAQHVDDLAPNMGLWWYFFAEIFEHFRSFFIFVFHAQSVLLLVPLTIRLQQTPLVLALIACMLMALFKVCTPVSVLGSAYSLPAAPLTCCDTLAVVHVSERPCLVQCLASCGSA